MPTKIKNKCTVCRFGCKTKTPEDDCKFIPREEFLGFEMHFNDGVNKPKRSHDSTSRICVVCKDYFHYKKITWLKGAKKGLYSFCPEDARRQTFIIKNMG